MSPTDFPSATRRQALTWIGAGAAACFTASPLGAADLPLRTTGLEHIGMTVPDQEATAKFYGRIFDLQLFQESDPPPRFYVRTGISYIAFGGGAGMPARIDHFCALVEDYKAQDMRKSLEDAGITVQGRGALGMPADPDGLRLQHDLSAIAFMKKYIADWDAGVAASKTPAEMRAKVLQQYPGLGMEFTLNDRIAAFFPSK
jgi:catechol 2,3-dioxygenase-like lactoylglutathione lyase family enzyme